MLTILKRNKILGIIFFVFSFFFLVTNVFAVESGAVTESTVIPKNTLAVVNSEDVAARVLSVEQLSQSFNERLEDSQGFRVIAIEKLSVKILEGKYKGIVHTLENSLTTNTNNIEVDRGDKILVKVNEFDNGTYEVIIKDSYRISTLYFFGLAFLIVLALIFHASVIKILLLFLIMSGSFYWLVYLLLHTSSGVYFFLPLIASLFVSALIIFGIGRNYIISLISSIIGITFSFIVYTILKPFLFDRGLISTFGVTEYTFDGILFVVLLSTILWASVMSSKIALLSLQNISKNKKYRDFILLYQAMWKLVRIRILYVFLLLVFMFQSFMFIFIDLMQDETMGLTYTTLLNQEIFLFALLVIFTLFAALFSSAFIVCLFLARERFGFMFISKQDKLF